MENLHILESIISKYSSEMSDGEYLNAMNAIQKIYQLMPPAPAEEEYEDEDFWEEVLEEPEIEVLEAFEEPEIELLPRARPQFALNNFEMELLVNASVEPVMKSEEKAVIVHEVQNILNRFEIAPTRAFRAKLSVALYSFIFQNFAFLFRHKRFGDTVLQKLEQLHSDNIYTTMGYSHLMSGWLEQLKYHLRARVELQRQIEVYIPE